MINPFEHHVYPCNKIVFGLKMSYFICGTKQNYIHTGQESGTK